MSPIKSKWTPNVISKIQTISVNKSKQRVNINCVGIKFQDKDTRQFIFYIPALDLSGYGSTPKKAEEMLYFSSDEFCKQLVNSTPEHVNVILTKLGWKRNHIIKKEYSTAYIDLKGNLNDFNAMDDKIELVDITTAA